MKSKKELGQNFLTDKKAINEIIKAADIQGDDLVVEVGSGKGALTYPLAKRAKKVVAIEIDKDLIPKLQERVKKLKNIQIINADFLALKSNQYAPVSNFKIIGSIPYQITSPLIHKLLKEVPRPKSITIIVQKEVAEKITATAPKATYLSNFVANFGKAKIIKTIDPQAFHPQPKVGSALLHIILHPQPHISDSRFEPFLHHGFSQPRKMLNKQFPSEILQKLKINPQRRPQTLKFKEWVNLYKRTKGLVPTDKLSHMLNPHNH